MSSSAMRLAKAAAARGRGGNVDEPEMEDGHREPVHKAHGGACYACGGVVDEHGKAMSNGGEVEKEYDGDDGDDGEGYSRQESPDARRRFAHAARERR